MSKHDTDPILKVCSIAGPETTASVVRVRLHGRGGHGVKTASRILGTAAFLAGFEAQDSPIYGAERRGAAVAAFVRISTRPVLERGPIATPDLIVVADETLLRDPMAGVLAGQDGASAIFINTSTAESLVEQFQIRPLLQVMDISSRTKEILGRASALSAGLGAAAARLTGLVQLPTLLEAMRQEFTELGLAAGEIDKNLRVGEEVFERLHAVVIQRQPSVVPGELVRLRQSSARASSPSILQPGNSALRNTGAWRIDRPVLDETACSRCGLCSLMCPDGAIRLDERGYPVIDYEHCKGCMICQQLCPLEAIGREKETRAW